MQEGQTGGHSVVLIIDVEREDRPVSEADAKALQGVMRDILRKAASQGKMSFEDESVSLSFVQASAMERLQHRVYRAESKVRSAHRLGAALLDELQRLGVPQPLLELNTRLLSELLLPNFDPETGEPLSG